MPFLVDLDLLPSDPDRRRLTGKQPCPEEFQHRRSFRRSWRHYISGHVVSQYATRIIRYLLMAVAAEGHHHDKADDLETEARDLPCIAHEQLSVRRA